MKIENKKRAFTELVMWKSKTDTEILWENEETAVEIISDMAWAMAQKELSPLATTEEVSETAEEICETLLCYYYADLPIAVKAKKQLDEIEDLEEIEEIAFSLCKSGYSKKVRDIIYNGIDVSYYGLAAEEAVAKILKIKSNDEECNISLDIAKNEHGTYDIRFYNSGFWTLSEIANVAIEAFHGFLTAEQAMDEFTE